MSKNIDEQTLLYYEVSGKKLYAYNAFRALNDFDGNKISDTYLTKADFNDTFSNTLRDYITKNAVNEIISNYNTENKEYFDSNFNKLNDTVGTIGQKTNDLENSSFFEKVDVKNINYFSDKHELNLFSSYSLSFPNSGSGYSSNYTIMLSGLQNEISKKISELSGSNISYPEGQPYYAFSLGLPYNNKSNYYIFTDRANCRDIVTNNFTIGELQTHSIYENIDINSFSKDFFNSNRRVSSNFINPTNPSISGINYRNLWYIYKRLSSTSCYLITTGIPDYIYASQNTWNSPLELDISNPAQNYHDEENYYETFNPISVEVKKVLCKDSSTSSGFRTVYTVKFFIKTSFENGTIIKLKDDNMFLDASNAFIDDNGNNTLLTDYLYDKFYAIDSKLKVTNSNVTIGYFNQHHNNTQLDSGNTNIIGGDNVMNIARYSNILGYNNTLGRVYNSNILSSFFNSAYDVLNSILVTTNNEAYLAKLSNSIALGKIPTKTTLTDSILLDIDTDFNNTASSYKEVKNSISIGHANKPLGENSVLLGRHIITNDSDNIVLSSSSYDINVNGTNNIVIDTSDSENMEEPVAMRVVSGDNNVLIGTDVNINGESNSILIGTGASSIQNNTKSNNGNENVIAIGKNAKATNNSVALGNDILAPIENSVSMVGSSYDSSKTLYLFDETKLMFTNNGINASNLQAIDLSEMTKLLVERNFEDELKFLNKLKLNYDLQLTLDGDEEVDIDNNSELNNSLEALIGTRGGEVR